MSDAQAAKGKPSPHRLIVAAELHLMKTAGIIEVAARNPNVAEYVKHWEGRALKAESAIAAARAEGMREGMLQAAGIALDAAYIANSGAQDAHERGMSQGAFHMQQEAEAIAAIAKAIRAAAGEP